MSAPLQTVRLVRDYIFVDDIRVRSRLSQLMGGVPEQEQGQRTRTWRQGFSQMLQVQRGTQDQLTETRSLSNLHAAMLEDEAAAAGMLPDVTDIASKEHVWRKGKFRRLFVPGGLFKIHSATSIIAAQQTSELVDEFDSSFSAGPGAGEFSAMVKNVLSALYGEQLGLRIFPCGVGIAEKTFSGLFADVNNYLGAEKSLLLPRFGSDAAELTTIAQVTRISSQTPTTQATIQASVDSLTSQIVQRGNSINRGALESLLQQMLKMMENFGFMDAPRWPSIGILPVAIYRNVPAVSDFESTVSQLLLQEED